MTARYRSAHTDSIFFSDMATSDDYRPKRGRSVLTKIDAVYIQQSQTLRAGLLAVRIRAIDLKSFTTFDEAELGGEEDVVASAGALEPAADELLGGAVQAGYNVSDMSLEIWTV